MRILIDLHRKCGWKLAQKKNQWIIRTLDSFIFFFRSGASVAHGKYGFANPSYLILLVIHEIHYYFVFFLGRKLQCQLAAYWMVDMIPFKMNIIQVELPFKSIQQNSQSMLVSWMRWSLHCADNKNPAARSQSRMCSTWSGQRKCLAMFIWDLLMEEILYQLISSLSHHLQGFIHPSWCRISSINSMWHLSPISMIVGGVEQFVGEVEQPDQHKLMHTSYLRVTSKPISCRCQPLDVDHSWTKFIFFTMCTCCICRSKLFDEMCAHIGCGDIYVYTSCTGLFRVSTHMHKNANVFIGLW